MRDRWTRAQLQDFQATALNRLRQHAYARSRFYQRFHRGHFTAPLTDLPVLTKADVMGHFDELITDTAVRRSEVECHVAEIRRDERFLGRYWVCATSGTTGERGLFVFDANAWVDVLASFGRGGRWAGMSANPLRHRRIAAVASTTPWHMSTRTGVTTKNPLTSSLWLDAGMPVGALVAQLNAQRPHILIVYPSIGRVLAEEQLARRLRISPSHVLTGSEVVTADRRRRMEAAWGPVVSEQYAATEAGGIAAECERHSGLHIGEDRMILEVVDEANQPVPAGTPGAKVLLTVLFNHTQPLIRYELADMVTIAPTPCSCGRPFRLITQIQGRSADLIRLRGATGGAVTVHPIVFERVFDRLPVDGWRIIHSGNQIRILLSGVPAEVVDEQLLESLRSELSARGVTDPSMTIERVAVLPRGVTGKSAPVDAGPA
jgi:putative adenylate-forming enzyme